MEIYYQARNKRMFLDSVPVANMEDAYFNEPYCDTVLRCFEEEKWEKKEGGMWIYDPVPPKPNSTSMAHDRWVTRICDTINNNIVTNKIYFDYDDSRKRIYLRNTSG